MGKKKIIWVEPKEKPMTFGDKKPKMTIDKECPMDFGEVEIRREDKH